MMMMSYRNFRLLAVAFVGLVIPAATFPGGEDTVLVPVDSVVVAVGGVVCVCLRVSMLGWRCRCLVGHVVSHLISLAMHGGA